MCHTNRIIWDVIHAWYRAKQEQPTFLHSHSINLNLDWNQLLHTTNNRSVASDGVDYRIMKCDEQSVFQRLNDAGGLMMCALNWYCQRQAKVIVTFVCNAVTSLEQAFLDRAAELRDLIGNPISRLCSYKYCTLLKRYVAVFITNCQLSWPGPPLRCVRIFFWT